MQTFSLYVLLLVQLAFLYDIVEEVQWSKLWRIQFQYVSCNEHHLAQLGVSNIFHWKSFVYLCLTLITGSSNIQLVKNLKKADDAWEIHSNVLYGSSDASLFSSSLPVLRHDKCMLLYLMFDN